MCTLTIVPFEDGVQVACNRDERLDRPAAQPPQVHLAGSLLAAFPTDLTGGGTWIGVNERGLVASILNRTEHGDRPASAKLRCSRGLVVRHVLAAEDMDHALARVSSLPLRAFDPFNLVLVQGDHVAVVTNDGREYGVTAERIDRPLCFTSSSLGDSIVRGPRLELFDDLVAEAREPLLMQGAFQAHRWPERPAISVEMRRPDAATVSRTWITVERERARLTYESLLDRITPPEATEIPCTLSLASSSRRS